MLFNEYFYRCSIGKSLYSYFRVSCMRALNTSCGYVRKLVAALHHIVLIATYRDESLSGSGLSESQFYLKQIFDFSQRGKQMSGWLTPIIDALRPLYSVLTPSFFRTILIVLKRLSGYFALQFYSFIDRKISACMRVRTIQNGFIIMLVITPPHTAERPQRLKLPSCRSSVSR